MVPLVFGLYSQVDTTPSAPLDLADLQVTIVAVAEIGTFGATMAALETVITSPAELLDHTANRNIPAALAALVAQVSLVLAVAAVVLRFPHYCSSNLFASSNNIFV